MQTLVDVPSPQQATFIRQAHLATQQQLNNNMAPEPRAREVSKKATNELWEDQSYAAEGIRLDCRAARKAGHADPELAPVGHFDRPKNSRR
ncbi:MAG TPA: hypothetical protein VKB53_06940 [Gammaproteobacteria bacterium]|nr:hypothetical protein [Gammaproteobacteria bacterium]HKH20606.1 hypothetical protein [Gammaproteobacteria bacterium]